MSNHFLIFLLITSFTYSQQFSPDIIVEGPNPNHVHKSMPAIQIDEDGNLGILWAVSSYFADSIKFVKSYDKGITFDTPVIVDTLLVTPDAGFPYVSFIHFDSLKNPMVYYWRWIFPFAYFHYYKKSDDGGQNFRGDGSLSISGRWMIDYLNFDDYLSFLTYNEFPHSNILVKKSIDNGLTYIDSTVANTSNNLPDYSISLVKCLNDDILCIYTGSDASSHRRIFYNRSSDLGQTFSSVSQIDTVYESSTGIYAESYKNYIFSVYRAYSASIANGIVFTRSDDNGFTFNYSKELWDFGSFPMSTHPAPFLVFNPHVGLCVIWTEYGGSVDRTWFTHSTDYGANFSTPVLVVDGHHWRAIRSMAVSDSGDVYIIRVDETDGSIILKKTTLPVLSEVKFNNTSLEGHIKIHSNYPNPFNISTTISFYIPKPNQIEVKIYDTSGRLIITLVSGKVFTGDHDVIWNGRNSAGNEVSSGIYICRITAENYSQSRKLILIK